MTFRILYKALFTLALLCLLSSGSAVGQQDTFNVQTQPKPMNPSDVFSSNDCRTSPAPVLQQWQDYYQVMRSVIDRRDQEETRAYQSEISSEQNPDIRRSLKAHYDYEVNVVDAIWRRNTDSAYKCVRNYILSGCKDTLNCPVQETPPFKQPSQPITPPSVDTPNICRPVHYGKDRGPCPDNEAAHCAFCFLGTQGLVKIVEPMDENWLTQCDDPPRQGFKYYHYFPKWRQPGPGGGGGCMAMPKGSPHHACQVSASDTSQRNWFDEWLCGRVEAGPTLQGKVEENTGPMLQGKVKADGNSPIPWGEWHHRLARYFILKFQNLPPAPGDNFTCDVYYRVNSDTSVEILQVDELKKLGIEIQRNPNSSPAEFTAIQWCQGLQYIIEQAPKDKLTFPEKSRRTCVMERMRFHWRFGGKGAMQADEAHYRNSKEGKMQISKLDNDIESPSDEGPKLCPILW